MSKGNIYKLLKKFTKRYRDTKTNDNFGIADWILIFFIGFVVLVLFAVYF